MKDFSRGVPDLEQESRSELKSLSKNRIFITLGQEKKTHLLREARKKIARLKTLINQKKFLAKV